MKAFIHRILASCCTCLVALSLAVPSYIYAVPATPQLVAEHALLIDLKTHTELLNKAADVPTYPASTTKVMTALVALERIDPQTMVTIEASDINAITPESSRAGLKAGDRLSMADLLACLLIPSGNEAAYAIARIVAGGTSEFAQLMNERAESLGCTHTHFTNPAGLHDPQHVTTAADMAKILEAALANQTFRDITHKAQASVVLPDRTLQLVNTNELLHSSKGLTVEGAEIYGKTGYTPEAGKCLVASAVQGDRQILAVVLKSSTQVVNGATQNSRDMYALLSWGLHAWKTEVILPAHAPVGSRPIRYAQEAQEVSMASAQDIWATVPVDIAPQDIQVSLQPSGELKAPLTQGTEMGIAEVRVQGRLVGATPVYSTQSLSLDWIAYGIAFLSEPLHFIGVTIAVTVLLLIIATISSIRRRRRRMRRPSYRLR